MTDLVLYHALISTCSQKVRYALGTKGLGYQSRLLDLSKLDHLKDGYLAINPNGVVPAITHGGAPVTDSSVICEYLEEVSPNRPIAPRDALGRARMRAWMRHFEEVSTPAVRPLSFNAVFVKGVTQMSDARRAWMLERTPLRRHFYRRLGTDGFAQEVVVEAEERLDDCFARVEAALAQNGPLLLGAAITIADMTLLPSMVRLLDLGRSDFWAGRPRLAAWLEHMMAEPAFADAYPPGSRLYEADPTAA